MKMYKAMRYPVLVAIFFVLASCGSDIQETPSVYEGVEFELNNGQKWDVSDNMMVYMTESFQLIETAEKNSDVDYQQLAEDLDELKNEFVSACDMQGHGHDVLHAWLMPYLDLLDKLTESKNKEEQIKILSEISWSKETFKTYFK